MKMRTVFFIYGCLLAIVLVIWTINGCFSQNTLFHAYVPHKIEPIDHYSAKIIGYILPSMPAGTAKNIEAWYIGSWQDSSLFVKFTVSESDKNLLMKELLDSKKDECYINVDSVIKISKMLKIDFNQNDIDVAVKNGAITFFVMKTRLNKIDVYVYALPDPSEWNRIY